MNLIVYDSSEELLQKNELGDFAGEHVRPYLPIQEFGNVWSKRDRKESVM